MGQHVPPVSSNLCSFLAFSTCFVFTVSPTINSLREVHVFVIVFTLVFFSSQVFARIPQLVVLVS